MTLIFQKNLQFGDIRPRNRQKAAQIEVFGRFSQLYIISNPWFCT